MNYSDFVDMYLQETQDIAFIISQEEIVKTIEILK